jgi:hypothetical protein
MQADVTDLSNSTHPPLTTLSEVDSGHNFELNITYTISAGSNLSGSICGGTAAAILNGEVLSNPSVSTVTTTVTSVVTSTVTSTVTSVSNVSGSGHSTITKVSCSPSSIVVNTKTTCTAKVTDDSPSPTLPTGRLYSRLPPQASSWQEHVQLRLARRL